VVEQVVHVRQSKFGSRRIVHELREKGIPENLIATALPNMRETEQDRALEVWRKRFNATPADAKELGRQARFLMGRGFAADVIQHVLRHSDEEIT
jgi:regulatory protein